QVHPPRNKTTLKGQKSFFVYGFSKSELGNIRKDEEKQFKKMQEKGVRSQYRTNVCRTVKMQRVAFGFASLSVMGSHPDKGSDNSLQKTVTATD
ncbi:MAG: hypothetical protein U9Q58_07540, partial [Pseudomonadota bacterium]|nr:hypothetical protein [Pseudomonadota bacterium]